MQLSVSREDFVRVYEAGRPQIVTTRLVADLETPVSAALKLADGQPDSFLLESVEGGAFRGRYSAIGFKPDLIWRCRDGRAEINRQAKIDRDRFEAEELGPMESLRRLVAACRIDDYPAGVPSIAAGLFGYLGYDMVHYMERLPDANPDTLGIPEAVLIRPTVVAVFDNIEDLVTLCTPAWPDSGLSAEAAYDRAAERLRDAVDSFGRSLPHRRERSEDAGHLPEPVSNTPKEVYLAAVEKAKAYIRAGDIFQVVPSQRFRVPFSLPSISFYRALRRLNPSPFLFHLDLGDFSVVGSSPEIMVRLRG
ncbi:MAG: chorismate-binding protein, partial [Azospirillaceae bacterium]